MGRQNVDHQIFLPDEAATSAFASKIAPLLKSGDVVFLTGGLGAGKSSVARSIIQARMPEPEDVPSPTYTLVQTYELPDITIWHADLYRLSDPEECDELGLTDAMENDLCLIEWPDILQEKTPARRLCFDLSIPDDQIGRLLNITAHGNWDEFLECLDG